MLPSSAKPESRRAAPMRAARLALCLGLAAPCVRAYAPGLKPSPARNPATAVSDAALREIARKLAANRPVAAPKAVAGEASPATGPSLTSLLRDRKAWIAPAAALPMPGRSPANPAVPMDWLSANGTPIYLEGGSLKAPEPSAPSGLTSAPGDRAMAYFRANRDRFKLGDPAAELRYLERNVDAMGDRHEIFQQMFRDVPVWGGRIHAHFDRNGALYAVNARYAPTPAPAGGWSLDGKAAIARAAGDLASQGPLEDFAPETRELLAYPGPLAERNVWIDEATGAARWAWRVEIRPDFCHLWRYFIDAGTGAILEKYDTAPSDGPKTASAKDLFGNTITINTYQVGSTYYLIDGTRKSFDARTGLPNNPKGALMTTTAGNTDLTRISQVTSANNSWTDAASVSAQSNMAKVYEYYLGTHNRNGIDGAGGTMIAAVHVTQNGQAMDNAYWNGRLMAYGDGSRIFKSLARALDVTGHEMTHGIIAATVNLDYKNQAGALNESLADVFGCMIDRDDWKMGEDIVNSSQFPTGALRDLADPHNGGRSRADASWQPAHMMEIVKASLSDDNGGVHINNGIPNHAAYLLAQAIGREKTEKIYYRVLDARYLNPGAQFLDMRLGAVRAATDLFGDASPEVAAVKDAFTQVGIGSATTNDTPTPRPPDRNPRTGQQYVAVVEAKAGDSSLYLAKPVVTADTDIVHISTTQVYTGSGRPVAVSADGSLIMFVDVKHALRAIDAAGERVVDAAVQWKSVAVSPDGSKAAATTLKDDAKIHILDLAHPDQSRTVQLYTPSTGQGTQANNVVSADALEFNSTGESVIYDALNSVPQSQGNPIQFWDANVVDLQTGVITPFLPTLPDGVSVGNPSFAQTTDLNVTFDLIDEYTGTFSAIAADLFTGTFKAVDSGSTVPCGPRYSTRDDKIVFTRASGTALNVLQIPMGKDKITPAGKAASYVANAQKPLWFARAPRSTGFRLPGPASAADFVLGEDAGGALRLELPSAAEIAVTVYDAGGRRRAELASGRRAAGSHRIAWDVPAGAGVYLVRARAKPESGPERTISRWIVR